VNPKDESAVVLTVDAEEWFHVPGSAAYAGESSWDGLPAAFPRAMERTLGFLEEGGWKATFFVLGWLAKRYPSEVRAIALAGHEVACHGLEHRLVSGMSPGHFRADVSEAKSLLEDLTGLPVRGFRAPRWSMPRASWPYEALAFELKARRGRLGDRAFDEALAHFQRCAVQRLANGHLLDGENFRIEREGRAQNGFDLRP